MSSFQVLNGKIMGGPVIPVESMKLLWSNPNPNAAFEAQNITLASDDYDFLLWNYKATSNETYFISSISPKGEDTILSMGRSFVQGALCYQRTITRNSDTSFSVGVGSYSIGASAAVEENTVCIPTAVYGFKKNSIGGGDDSHLMKYSTNEQIVGEWIDGKPIYQKTINFGSLPAANANKSVNHSVSNFERLVSVKGIGIVNGTTSYFDCSSWSAGATESHTRVLVDNTNVSFYNPTTTDMSTFSAYFTIQYTKTTD